MSRITSGTSHGGWTKRMQRKLHLSIIVCGPTGTGKTTFLNTLVGRQVLDTRPAASLRTDDEEVVLRPTTVEINEDDGTHLVLTLTDTAGLGDRLDTTSDIDALANYIECRFDEVLAEESRIRRNPRFKDDRVDACLYFIEPTGHGLRETDIRAMQRLGTIVNLIPVLARADSLTAVDRLTNKRLIMEDIQAHDIKLFDFLGLGDDDELDEGGDEVSAAVVTALPLAITSCTEYDANGSALWLRKLAHGTVEVLNPEHSDFKMLKDTLLGTHLVELREMTRYVLYEAYRTARLDPRRDHRSSLLLPQELAEHSARLKEAQLQRDTKQLQERDQRLRLELEEKRREIQQREQELRDLELRIAEKQIPAEAPERKLHKSTSQQLQTDKKQLASLEAQRQSIHSQHQNSMATAASSHSLHAQSQHQPQQSQPVVTAAAPGGPRDLQPRQVHPQSGSAQAATSAPSFVTAPQPATTAPTPVETPVSDATPVSAAAPPVPTTSVPHSNEGLEPAQASSQTEDSVQSGVLHSPEKPVPFVQATSPLQIKKSAQFSTGTSA